MFCCGLPCLLGLLPSLLWVGSLPALYLFVPDMFLRLSLGFAVHQLLAGIISLLPIASTLPWFQYPLMIFVNAPIFYFADSSVLGFYRQILGILAPLLLLFLSIQTVFLIVKSSKVMVNQLGQSESSDKIWKSAILSLSFLAYLIASIIIFTLYSNQYDQLTPLISSWVSCVMTVCVGLSILVTFFIESGIISEVAFLTAFEAFLLRGALRRENKASGFQNLVNAGEILFDLDFILTAVLVVFNLVWVFLPDPAKNVVYLKKKFQASDDDEEDNEDSEKPPLFFRLGKQFSGVLFVLFLTYVLQSGSGDLESPGIGFRVAQTVLSLGLYVYLLLKSNADEDEFHFKSD